MPESNKLVDSLKAKTRMADKLKLEISDIKKLQAFRGSSPPRNEQAKNTDLGGSFREDDSRMPESPRKPYINNFFNSSQGIVPDGDKKSGSQSRSPKNRPHQSVNDVHNTSQDISYARQPTQKDAGATIKAKSKGTLLKRSLFRALVEEQEAKHTMMTMNDNSLSSLIFADPENIDDQAGGRYDRMVEKLALKNIHLATLNNILASRKTFTRILMNMTESNSGHMFETLKMLYIEVIELLKGAQQIRNIFEAAPMIATSMSVEQAMSAIVDYVCQSLKCERATMFALDHDNQELWSKIATGKLL